MITLLFFAVFAIGLVVPLFILKNNKKLKKLLEEKNIQLNQKNLELEELLSSFEKNVIYLMMDLEENITSISEAFCRVSGFSESELVGKSHKLIRDPNTPKEFFDDILRNLQVLGYVRTEMKNIKKDGSTYWVEVGIEAVYDSNDECIGYRSIGHVITAKKELEELKNTLEFKVQNRTKELLDIRQEVEALHKKTQDSIEYASIIQHAIIPSNDLFRKYFSEYLTIWHPKDVVGGDIYLFNELRGEDESLLMVIDCTGHGVSGAFVTMLVKAIERQIVAKIKNSDEVVNPAQILSVFNKSIKHLLKQDSGLGITNVGFDGTIFYYNKKEKMVRFACANSLVFYIEESKLKTVKGDRCSIGYRNSDADFEFTLHEMRVKEGMSFYLTTDGYLDQNGGEKGFPFGRKRFCDLIEANIEECMADHQEIFLYEMQGYQGKYERNDDVTIIGVKI